MSAPSITQVGRYRIVQELGRGAMGIVYKAEDPELNRIVAIKTILMSTDAEERAEYEARFRQEARAAAGLNHPSIITVHDIGREGELMYMAMELLEGKDLRDTMESGPLPLALALDLAAQVADGLAFAHERGVVHRDIKPANIMLVHGRHAKLMDFGIAKLRLSDIKTQTGAILGSPKYMSPEQVNGERTDHRSDIFSLGVTVYEMLAGQAPFSGATLGELMLEISSGTLRPPSSLNRALPQMADLVTAKALQKDPDARYQSARELADDLRACRAGLPASAEVPMLEAIEVAPSEGTKSATAELSTTFRGTRKIALRFSAAREFESSEATERLRTLRAELVAARTPVQAIKAMLRDPDQRRLAYAIVAAAAVGTLIALL